MNCQQKLDVRKMPRETALTAVIYALDRMVTDALEIIVSGSTVANHTPTEYKS